MNRLFASFYTLIAFCSLICHDLNSQSLQSEVMSYDFGIVEQSEGNIEHKFELKNVSGSSIIIKEVKEECSCTTPLWNNDSILPNTFSTITVGYRSDLYSGSFQKQVTVYTNLDSFNLEIKGKVIPLTETQTQNDFPIAVGALQFKKSSFSMKTVYDQFIAEKEFSFYNSSDQTISEIITEGLPSFISLSLINNVPAKSQGVIKVKYDPTKFIDYGFVSHNFTLLSGDIKKAFTISANVTPYVPKYTEKTIHNAPVIEIIGGNEHDFGNIQSDSSYSFDIKVKNTGKSDLKLLQVKPSCQCVTVKASGKEILKPNESTTVTVSLNTKDRKGKTKKRIYLYSNDPLNLALIYTLSGKVKIAD